MFCNLNFFKTDLSLEKKLLILEFVTNITKMSYSFSPYTNPPDERRGEYQTIGESRINISVEQSSNTTLNPDSLTSMNFRYDYLASFSYIFGFISGILILILEQRNDYVRYHAWQSSILGIIISIR